MEAANIEKGELKSHVGEPTTKVTSLKIQLNGVGEAFVNKYLEHLHKIVEYDSLSL